MISITGNNSGAGSNGALSANGKNKNDIRRKRIGQ